MRKLSTAFLILLFAGTSFAQGIKISLGRMVNSALIHEKGAAISGDGKTLIFSRQSKGEWFLYTSTKKGKAWSRPVEIEVLNKSPKLMFPGAYCLNFDGTELYYTSNKRGGVGNWDLWVTKKSPGGSWLTPENLAKPVNTSDVDAFPSISADGKHLYFMRAPFMKYDQPGKGKIYRCERIGKSSWSEPEELPSTINTGNETAPNIMADGMTLIYSSSMPGGKGGLDIYMTRKEGKSWSKPIPYDFINTTGDDQHITIDARANAVYYSAMEMESLDIFMGKIPDTLRPIPVYHIKGKVTEEGTNAPMKSLVQAYDLKTNKLVYTAKTDDKGIYTMVLAGGAKYDYSVQVLDKKHVFYSEVLNLKDLDKYKKASRITPMALVKKGNKFILNTVEFKKGKSSTKETAERDLKRLAKLLKYNPDAKIEVGIHMDEVLRDSVESTELTELAYDTTWIEPGDTITIASDSIDGKKYALKAYYHNDRTQKQANKLTKYILEKGISESRFTVVAYSDEKNIVANDTKENRKKNKRVEVIFTE